jgi:hypothetical protein
MDVIVYLNRWFIFVPTLIGLILFIRLPLGLKVIVLYLLLGCLSEYFGKYFAVHYKNNAPVFNISYLLHFVFLYLFFFYSKSIPIAQNKNKVYVLLLFLFIWCIDNLIIHSIFKHNYWFLLFFYLLILTSSINLLLSTFNSEIVFYKNSYFYFALSILLYYTFLNFINILTLTGGIKKDHLFFYIRPILSIVLLTKYILFTVGFLWTKKK